jgi:hypothetical protein
MSANAGAAIRPSDTIAVVVVNLKFMLSSLMNS